MTIARVPFKSSASQPTICLELASACTQQSKFSNWSIIKLTAAIICTKSVFKLTKWKEQEAASHPVIILFIDMGHSVRKITSHHPQKAIAARLTYPLDPLSLNYVQKASFSFGCFLSTHSMGSSLSNLFFNSDIKQADIQTKIQQDQVVVIISRINMCMVIPSLPESLHQLSFLFCCDMNRWDFYFKGLFDQRLSLRQGQVWLSHRST